MPKPPGKSPKITFVLYPRALCEAIEARREDGKYAGLTARRDLERYYHALQQALATIEFNESEAALIVDACNGIIFEPHTMQLLWAQIEDAVRSDRLDAKWDADAQVLVAKMRALSYWQALAVADAIERFWNLPTEQRSIPEGLRVVGLLKTAT
jgi:hypothetical protein